MDRKLVRLECLKLVNRHDHHPDEVVARAKVFEEYIESTPAEKVVEPQKVRKKVVGNSDILS